MALVYKGDGGEHVEAFVGEVVDELFAQVHFFFGEVFHVQLA